MTKEEFIDKLKTNKLEHYIDNISPLIEKTIRLYLTSVNEGEILIWQSKIWWKPDLPENTLWPYCKEVETIEEKKDFFFTKKIFKSRSSSLSFIAQINLSEIYENWTNSQLPDTWILYFFYSSEQSAWWFDPKDKDKFKILYYDGDMNKLTRTDFPEDLSEYGKFRACAIKYESEISFPSYYTSKAYEFIDEKDEEVLRDIIVDSSKVNKMLGFPDDIQNNMEIICELASNWLYCWNSSVYKNSRIEEFKNNAIHWKLLLQIDSNDECGMQWWDNWRLYFLIKKADLELKNFDKSWLILECS